uniref:Cwf21 domain-containing protein n=1 Tax=Ascaris lumbricoides TaxID=6252 RepID=A0A0M3IKQ6_ASCLU
MNPYPVATVKVRKPSSQWRDADIISTARPRTGAASGRPEEEEGKGRREEEHTALRSVTEECKKLLKKETDKLLQVHVVRHLSLTAESKELR